MMSSGSIGKTQINVPFSLGSWYLIESSVIEKFPWKILVSNFLWGFEWWFIEVVLGISNWWFEMTMVEIVNYTQPTTSFGSCTPRYHWFLLFQCNNTGILFHRLCCPTVAIPLQHCWCPTIVTTAGYLFFFLFPIRSMPLALRNFFFSSFPLKNILWIS